MDLRKLISFVCQWCTVSFFVFFFVIRKENLFGSNQVYHDINEPDFIRENKIVTQDDLCIHTIDDSYTFDPRNFRPLMVTLRVALHNITAHVIHVKIIFFFAYFYY